MKYNFTWTWCPEYRLTSFHFRDNLENIQLIRELSRLPGNFPGYPEIFRIIWKISSLSGNFPGYPENIQTIWKFYKWSGNFPVQFQGLRAKTFRVAMPPCHPGFCASELTESTLWRLQRLSSQTVPHELCWPDTPGARLACHPEAMFD